MAVTENVAFVWSESDGRLRIELPAPTNQLQHQESAGCAITLLLAAGVLLTLTLAALGRIAQSERANIGVWIGITILLGLACLIFVYALGGVRRAHTTRDPSLGGPSEIFVDERELRISRTGQDRGTDVAWDLVDIADVRICPTQPDRLLTFFFIKEALTHAFFAKDELVRVSVMDVSGQIDDVILVAPGRYWPQELEDRLRSYLGLAETS
jgi:hypothetical protein